MSALSKKTAIAMVKIAQKDLGLDDATYRDMLHNLCGKDSAAKCSIKELITVLDELRKKGWKQTKARPSACATASKPRGADPSTDPLRKKIIAQCYALKRPMAYADGVLQRMYGAKMTLNKASREQLGACISALTKMQGKAT